jgi:hypothetical protein
MEYLETGRETIILHTGDFDPDSVELFKVFSEGVHEFVEGYDEDPSIVVFKRVMLTSEQVWSLPEDKKSRIDPAELKEKNYRGQKWLYPYKVELQALNLEERFDVMRVAIEAELDLLDLDKLEEDREAHAEEVGAPVSSPASHYRPPPYGCVFFCFCSSAHCVPATTFSFATSSFSPGSSLRV